MSADPLDVPVFTAADWVARQRARGQLREAAPRDVVLIHQASLLEQLLLRWPARPVRGFPARLLLLRRAPGRVGVAGEAGLGAPAAAALTDQLAAWGVKRLVAVGVAGGLQTDLRSGDVIVCERALRGEGVSGHYLPPGRWAEAAPEWVDDVRRALDRARLAHRVGTSWTTDAPFRELRREALDLQREGVLTVEMEAAALLAVARAQSVAAACVLVVADTLAGGQWRWGEDSAVQHSLSRVGQALLEHLSRTN